MTPLSFVRIVLVMIRMPRMCITMLPQVIHVPAQHWTHEQQCELTDRHANLPCRFLMRRSTEQHGVQFMLHHAFMLQRLTGSHSNRMTTFPCRTVTHFATTCSCIPDQCMHVLAPSKRSGMRVLASSQVATAPQCARIIMQQLSSHLPGSCDHLSRRPLTWPPTCSPRTTCRASLVLYGFA